jgi:hypothetical protein
MLGTRRLAEHILHIALAAAVAVTEVVEEDFVAAEL